MVSPSKRGRLWPSEAPGSPFAAACRSLHPPPGPTFPAFEPRLLQTCCRI